MDYKNIPDDIRDALIKLNATDTSILTLMQALNAKVEEMDARFREMEGKEKANG